MPNDPLTSIAISSCNGPVGCVVTVSGPCGRHGIGLAAAHGTHDEQYPGAILFYVFRHVQPKILPLD